MNLLARCWLVLASLLPLHAAAHSLNDSYLDLEVVDSEVRGTLELTIPDLEIAVGIDADDNRQVTWGEIQQAQSAIRKYVDTHLTVSRQGQDCRLTSGEPALTDAVGGARVYLPLNGTCAATRGELRVNYSLLVEVDSSHRGVATVSLGGETLGHIFAPQRQSLSFETGSQAWFGVLGTFIEEGIWHILLGIDHVLFILAMLLGVVLHRRRNQNRQAVGKSISLDILKLVTAFTFAHSVTLVLATLEWVVLPARLVESVIALSVLVSGVNIIYPLFGDKHGHVAFGFGLIHGFGFASVLADLNLKAGLFLISLLGFNVGIEIGQLVIILLAAPVVISMNSTAARRRLVSAVSGLAIAQVGLLWFLQRGFLQ